MFPRTSRFGRDWDASYSDAAVTNPAGPSSGTYRVTRGGYYLSSAQYCRVSHRTHLNQNYSMSFIGLRLVLR